MSWNDFLFALVLAGSNVKTAPLTLNGYITGFGTEWGPLCAGAIVLLLPVFALSFKLHQHMTQTSQAGAVKGV
jgi:multiple sugar transport system permease protein